MLVDGLAVLLSGLRAVSVPPAGLALLAGAEDGLVAGRPISALPIASLGFDSLGRMEFCIQLELDHGVPLTPDRLAGMGDLGELLAFIVASRRPG